ncbi:hypothetical protein B0H16DRAFT_1487340 [Mycena metata]|uniref:Uncharacterized protein n=1 Tax=Mycena metata TaxID=1033252 RepID=A0AAD7GHT5_9AGAR|nr:hypothetical protein B0H16DRAFT_1487340 [Mycena metata]
MSNPPVFPTQFNSTDAVESTAIVWSEFTPDVPVSRKGWATAQERFAKETRYLSSTESGFNEETRLPPLTLVSVRVLGLELRLGLVKVRVRLRRDHKAQSKARKGTAMMAQLVMMQDATLIMQSVMTPATSRNVPGLYPSNFAKRELNELTTRRHNTLDDGMWEWQATKVKLIALTHIVDVREYLLVVECAGHIQHEWSRPGRYGIWTKTHFGFDVEILAQMRDEVILDQDNIATLGEAIEWGAHNIDLNTVKPGSLRRFKNMVIISWGPYHFFDLLKMPKMHIRNHQEGFPSLWQLEEFVRWHLEEEFMSWCNPLEDGMEWAYNTTQAPEAYNINATAVRMQSLQRFQNAVITGVISRTFHLSSDGNFKFNHRGVSPPSPAQDSNEDDEEMPELRNCSGSDDSDEE